ncbi:hypothetical protein RRG08_058857 [Elysia crispata]|uniref:DDE Tnp4 domain-containing protein n=1 Tax=Elysia crispata TaxID=231223 RepID=A0AAE0Y0W4_9GAST|nr:hypothetical protein RRG08_058857 [Elysia crispata]
MGTVHHYNNHVEIVCNADLLIIDCVARHPGSFHDARVLRESQFFAGMEQRSPVVEGLGDSGYPLREWLMTPFGDPVDHQQNAFNIFSASTDTGNRREVHWRVEKKVALPSHRASC